nr:hypothetical protein [uncultured Methanoregula sp.]
MQTEMINLEKTRLWHEVQKNLIYRRGAHILGLGQTDTGKTNKGMTVNHWLYESGETLGIMDCGKPGEVLPYATFGSPLNFIIPSGCDVHVENSPVPIYKEYVETPELSWHVTKKGMINIYTFREHILDDLTIGEYASRFVDVLAKQVMRNMIEIPMPFCLDVDECSDIIPAYGLIENKYQKETASRFSRVLKKIRYLGIRVHAKDQAWGDVYPNARRQFAFLLLSRSPGTEGKTDVGVIKRYGFEGLRIDQARMIFPQRNWWGDWSFDRIVSPENMHIEYEGEVYWPRSRRKDSSHVEGEKKGAIKNEG